MIESIMAANSFASRAALNSVGILSRPAPGCHDPRRATFSSPLRRTQKPHNINEASRISAIILPPAANEGKQYGQQTSTETAEVGQFLIYPNSVRIAGKNPLRPEQKKLFTQPIEVSPDLEDATVIQELVPLIRKNLSCIRNSRGEVSVSAYDTAWVARIPHENGSGEPQFPRTLEWIVANQHPDGSWGDKKNWLFDRFVQTLSCVVALKAWNHSPSCVQRGVDYMTRNADRLEDEEIVTMPIGFELSFPAMLAEAKSLGLNLPYSLPFFQLLEELRAKKLQKIPLKLLHAMPTTLLHTLEGIQSLDINWAQVLKFQGDDGSMCCSPSSTAVLYMRTGDKKSLAFLEEAVLNFNHAVPTVYPLDTFHNLWVVDTLERLGISRYFKKEIDEILAEVYRHWSDERGICWARVLKEVPDLDDTSMAFRLLRQHGYKVSAEGFKDFQKDKGWACFAVGQMVQGVSDMYNLFRATQRAYPGEKRLAEAESFSRDFLVEAITNDKGDADKWSLKKDLSGEVAYTLKHPEHRSLHRMEVRHYLGKYGVDDPWIGKSIYRLRLVNNNEYLKLAKADFNLCQMLHQKELRQVLRWISNSGLADSSNVRERIVMLYAMFSAEVWEPEYSNIRIATGKCMFIAMAMHHLFGKESSLTDLRKLIEGIKSWDPSKVRELPEKFTSCFMVLYNTMNKVVINSALSTATASESSEPAHPIGQLVHLWGKLLSSFLIQAEWRARFGKRTDEGRKMACTESGLETIVLSSMLMSGEIKDPELVTWMGRDCALLRGAAEMVGLAQGIVFNKEKTTVDLTVMKQEMTKELNLEMAQASTLPSIVKRVLVSLTKVANFYYDGANERESLYELQRLWVSRVE